MAYLLGAFWRYCVCFAGSLIASYQPPIAVLSAKRLTTGEDCTADILGQLAALPLGSLEKDVIIKYNFKGTGPYSMISDRWPPSVEEGKVTPLERQIVAAYASSGEDEEDVTEEVSEFAGADGSGEFPPNFAKQKKWSKLTLSYADGTEKVVNFQ